MDETVLDDLDCYDSLSCGESIEHCLDLLVGIYLQDLLGEGLVPIVLREVAFGWDGGELSVDLSRNSHALPLEFGGE